MLSSHVLILLGIPAQDVIDDMRQVRMSHYEALRKFFPGHDAVGVTDEDLQREILHSVQVDDGDFAVNRSIGELLLQQMNVQIDTMRKDGIRVSLIQDDTLIHAGDVLVLYGKPEDVERAEAYILIG
jgi:CPA2 family monovalent cation:H+ antiporter-2